jgi:hypothetical protein
MAEEKLEAVTVHVPPETAAWLKGEAVRTERSVSFVVRKAVHMAACGGGTERRSPAPAWFLRHSPGIAIEAQGLAEGA